MSRKTILIAVLLAGLCAFGGWLLTGSDEVALPDAASTSARPVEAPAAANSVSTAREADAASDVAQRAAAEASASHGPSARLRILDERGEPVADAEVVCDETAKAYRDWPPAARPPASVPRVRSDATGLVHLPAALARAFVVAWAGERYGEGHVDFDDPLVPVPELRIAPDRTVHIAVVSPRGAPVPNVPVQYRYQSREAIVDEGKHRHLLPRTDAQGRVTLWHAQQLDFWDRTRTGLEVRALVYGADQPFVKLDLAEPPPELLTVVCPDHGSLRVRGWLEPGVPLPGELDPSVSYDGGPDLPGGASDLLLPGNSPAERVVHPLALERRFQVGAVQCGERTSEELRRAGQEGVVDLFAGRNLSFGRLQLVLPDGSPCAAQSVSVRGRNEFRLSTDAQGFLQLPLTSRAQRVQLQVAALRLFGWFEQPKAVSGQGRVVALGILRLQPMQRLAQGRLVEAETGRPLQGSVTAISVGAGNEPDMRNRQSSTATAADGAFELWGSLTGKLSLRGSSKRYAGGSLAIEAGASDLVLELRRARQLDALVLVDPGVTVSGMEVRVGTGSGNSGYGRGTMEPGQLRYRFDLPEHDDVTLEVLCEHEVETLASVPLAQWQAVDGGFQATVDLRGKVANLEVTITQTPAEPEVAGWLAAAGGGLELSLGCLYARPAGTRLPLRDVWFDHHFVLAVNKTSAYEAIAERDGSCERVVLRPGHNRIELPAPTVVRCTIEGLPAEAEIADVSVQVLRLATYEPLYEQLVAAGQAEAGPPTLPMPTTAAAWNDFQGWSETAGLQAGGALHILPTRGSYVAIPVVGDQPLLAAAVPFEVREAVTKMRVALRVTPEQLQAVRR